MNIGSIGKAIAGQALESTKKSVLDAVIAPDPKTKAAEAPRPAGPPSDIGAIILSQVSAMQKSLREDQELQLLVTAANETLRVNEIFVPAPAVLVFSGTDGEGNVTRIISPADKVQLVCRIVKTAEGATPRRVNIMTPRPRQEPAPAA